MASSHPPPPPLDLDLTILSAKHLKNVNWSNGGILKPYAVFWIDPDRRFTTRSDDSGSTKPIWNERFTLPLTIPPTADPVLTLEIFHSKHSETPKPLVATLRLPLRDITDPEDFARVRTYELLRPSGRPQGKIRLKLAIRERPLPPPPNYAAVPPYGYYYPHTAPPPPPAPAYPYGYPDSYYQQSAYYSTAPPSPVARPFSDRTSVYGGPGPSSGPSAPVDYTLPYEHKPKTGKIGMGPGLAVGGLAGAMGGLALAEGLKSEEGSVAPSEVGARSEYTGYRVEY